MKCFRHPVSDAIGLCKYCCKGMCSECAKDTSFGVVCSPPCEQEVRTIREIVERNRKIPPAAATRHFWGAIMLYTSGLIFFGFAVTQGHHQFQIEMIVMGVAMFLGGAASALISRRTRQVPRS